MGTLSYVAVLHLVYPSLMQSASILLLLLLHVVLVCPTTVTQYTPLEILVPGTDGAHQALTLQVPTTPGELRLRDPATLHASVALAYNAILEGAEKQSGLVDAKTPWLMNQPLHPKESWHHHTAANAGVLDSARFLITFSMAPALSTGGSPLHLAAAMNDAARIRELLGGGGLTIEGGEEGVPPLHVDTERESDGLTPLHFACSAGATLAARALLEGGANVEAVGKNGATPLMIAASFGHLEVVKLLVLEYHANLAASHAFAGTTALHFAAEMGRGGVITFLCSEGASVSARTSAGGTPLHTAADTNQSTSLAALLAPPCKADPNMLLNGDTTPMYLAAQRGLSAIVRQLAEAGGDLDFAMPAAPYKGTLVDLGGDGSGGDFDAPKPGAYYGEKNTKRGNGATALHAAVENGHADTVATLLSLGALQTTAMEGASPVLLAIQYKHPHIALLLLNSSEGGGEGAQINAQTPHDGQFPLGAATLAGYQGVVHALLAKGANVSLVDHQGRTALSLAISSGKWALAQEFIEYGGLKREGDRNAALEAAIGTRRVDALQMVLSAVGNQRRGGWLNTPLTDSTPLPPLYRVAALGWGEGCTALLAAGAVVPTGALLDKGNVFHASASVRSCGPCLQALLHSPTYKNSSAQRLHLASAGRGVLDFATPLHAAARSGCVEGVVELVKSGADAGATLRRSQSTPLHLALSSGGGGEGVVNALLDTVGETQGKVLLRTLDKEGRTPFHTAIASGGGGGGGKGLSTIFMQRLSDFNNDTRQSLVNTADVKGLTPLHTCLRSRACTPDVFHSLISLGASTKGGVAHAITGERRGKDRVGAVRTLLQGKEGGGLDDWDATLKSAVDTGDVELSEVVLKGASRGFSKGVLTAALGKAVAEGWVDMVALLVKTGGVKGQEADEGGTGKSALEVAMEGVHIKGRGDILKLLTATE